MTGVPARPQQGSTAIPAWPEGIRGEILEFLYRSLSIDDEWAEILPDGFRWWAHRLAQTVRVSEPVTCEDGVTAFRIAATIDAARIVEPTEPLPALIDVLNRMATLSGCYHDGTGRVRLGASMIVHEQNHEWVARLMLFVLAQQQVEAATFAELFSSLSSVSAVRDESPHPVSGFRDEPDEMATGVLHVIEAGSAQELPTDAEYGELQTLLNESGVALSMGSAGGITAEVPHGDETSLVMVENGVDHPKFGRGVLMRLMVPDVPDQNARRRAAAVRTAAFGDTDMSEDAVHRLGGWSAPEDMAVTALAVFLPAAIARWNEVMNLTIGLCAEARRLDPKRDSRDRPPTFAAERHAGLPPEEVAAIIEPAMGLLSPRRWFGRSRKRPEPEG